MSTSEIRPSSRDTSCDVCGRTLLRGERVEVYLRSGTPRSVCQLCEAHALHEGWVREGTAPAHDADETVPAGGRSLLGRLRARRDALAGLEAVEPDGETRSQRAVRSARLARERVRERARDRTRERTPEPRHVRAIPTSPEQKIASAIELFNDSEHRRVVAGVARSLGPPAVSVRPAEHHPGLVNVVVSWELCWYRYDVDLSDELATVRIGAQGSELGELSREERRSNAVADESGALVLRSR